MLQTHAHKTLFAAETMAPEAALHFDNAVDDPVWYHGFCTNVENLTDVHIYYEDGSMIIAGNPLIRNMKIAEAA